MNIDYVGINEYINSKQDNIFIKTFLYAIIIGLLLVLGVIGMSLIKIDNNYYGEIFNEKDEVFLYVDEAHLLYILQGSKLYINKNHYSYKILELIYEEKDKYKVCLDIDFKNSYLNNPIIKYKLLISEKSLMTYLKENIK